MLLIILWVIFVFLLILPLSVKKVEEHLEVFLLGVACIAVTASHYLGTEPRWTPEVIESAASEPLKLALATAVFGLIFGLLRTGIRKKILTWETFLGPRLFAAAVIFSLGILSSVITAIISALILCEVISALNLDKRYETVLSVLACYSIGMGAALTPLGEPLSTIALAKMKGGPHQVNFMSLIKLVGIYIIPGILVLSASGALLRGSEVSPRESMTEDYAETLGPILLRALKVYFFVAALILLGHGFKPVIDAYIVPMPPRGLYWINISSAVLDNATLVAAEISPHMSAVQIKGILMGAIIAGGMLIPGNIPNIISASKLGISSRTWAVVGVPVGLALMVVYYVFLFVLKA